MSDLYNIPVKTIQGESKTLADYKGKALLIVNTASQCGYTPQYAGLENIYKKYHEQGFYVLGFPANDFGAQEPGAESEIKQFCEMKFKTTFPMFSKVVVKGASAHPLYSFLQKASGAEVQWNFGKFLISRSGKLLKYYPSKVEPESKELTDAIESALKE